MTKDKSQKPRRGSAKKAATRRATVQQRAEFIINEDADFYSSDTREAIKAALDSNDENLAELVRRAESGEEIIDITKADTDESGTEKAVSDPVNSLTLDDVRRLTREINNYMHDEHAADLLLLCRALAMRKDGENLLFLGVEEQCAMYMPSYTDELVGRDLHNAFAKLRERE